ncbi:MAG: S8 family serine peptidase [Gammaproteobacteria bacterium]
MTHRRATAILTVVLATLTGCAAQRDRGPEAEIAPRPEQTPMRLRERQLIVTLKDPASASWVRGQRSRAIARDYELREIDGFPLESIGVQCVVYEVPEPRAADPESLDVIVERLGRDPRVESAQRNQAFYSLAGEPEGGYAKYQYGLASIGADRAHTSSTGKGVIVAVIDTGVDTGHDDLSGQFANTRSFVRDGDREFVNDAHGTAVAGIIAARADETGIVGVAPDADLLALKACWYPRSSGAQVSDGRARCSSWSLALAVDFAIESGAQVLNLSLTGPSDPLLTQLIDKALERDRIVVAAAASTRTGEASFPASLDAVVGVVSSDIDGRVQTVGWNKRGHLVAAPGVEILTTAPDQRYGFKSGSSLAAAHVSGVLALMLQAAPALDAVRAATLLNATTRPLIRAAGASAPTIGQVDACAALHVLGACG